LTSNIAGAGYNISNVSTISVTGNVSTGNVSVTGNVDATFVRVYSGIVPNVSASPAPTISGFGAISTTGTPGNITASGNLIASQDARITGNVTAGNVNITGNISSNVNGFALGYRDIPQVVFTSNATLALSDAGKHYFSSNSANVITIPNNTTVSFSIGTAISIIQQGTANLTVTPGSGVTMYLAGNSTSASRTVGNYGMATLMKVNTDTWFINGTGVT
jgi:hypothetical protein